MPTAGVFALVNVEEIDLDTANPRIARFLEHHSPPYSDDVIHLALETDGDDEGGSAGTSFTKLKQSVETNGGIVQPVLLQQSTGGRYVCVEGNTRVFLYREFKKRNVKGSWDQIPALVHANIDELDVHAIRLQAHLVGPRRWEPYSKAKYLYSLRSQDKIPLSQLIDLCGGNKKSILESLAAYEDMENYYRPLVGDENFDTTRFSGFIELQKPGIKEALLKGGFTVADFAQWIDDERIEKLQYVRSLPAVLKDDKAKKTFLQDGMEAAIKVLDRPQLNKALEDADLGSLARALRQAINGIAFKDFMRLKENPGLPAVQHLQEAKDSIEEFLNQLEAE